MSLLLDHPFFDAVGLGVDARKVGTAPTTPERATRTAPPETYAQRAAADPFADDESRHFNSAIRRAASANAPLLLEYHRAGDDEELNFIPKTVAGFALGAMAMGFCLNITALLLFTSHSAMTVTLSMAYRFIFAVGITGVASSLLLVGLKVRVDHTRLILHSRHWLNSIATGAVFAVLVWGPWLAIEHNVPIDHFIVAGIWMLLFFFPPFAARWTVGPAKQYGV